MATPRAFRMLALPSRHHVYGSFAILLFIAFVMSCQVTDRTGFADGDLHRDVIDRWGAPIAQAAPSVRYVSSGSVFSKLTALPLEAQRIAVDAQMNYRKRGLVSFSGFDFEFRGTYRVANPEPHDVDLVFVFPVQLERNQKLLSELAFRVDGEPVAIELGDANDKLVWTGRLARGESRSFEIRFKGRGLESFRYVPDPALPVRNLELVLAISGGENFDYEAGVVPATATEIGDGGARLTWRYASLESGVPMGAVLPSEQAFDATIATILRRAWAPFLLFLGAFIALATHARRELLFYETYLIAAGYGLFLVMLPYLAAYANFYLAYAVTCAAVSAVLLRYGESLLGAARRPAIAGLLVAFLIVPTLAVVLEGYTGLIYTLEIAIGLAVLMALSVRPEVRAVVAELVAALVVMVALAAPSAQAQGSPAQDATSRASLPLDELLELHRELDRLERKPGPAAPPLPATVDAFQVVGRLVDESLELEAQVAVTVLGDGWVSVPLLRLAPGLSVTETPALSGATLALHDGWLVLVTRESGRRRFSLGLRGRAPGGPGPHRVELETAQATVATLRIAYDDRLYTLDGPVVREGDGVRVDPDGTRFRVAWSAREGAAAPEPALVARPEREPVIAAAHASLVSTLEGRWLTRVHYDLRFTGSRTLEVRMPAGHRLAKVFRDGAPLPFATDGDVLRLELTPERSGGEQAVVELVLEHDHGPYHLAGRIDVALPEASWPIHELALVLHLPAVFEYAWLDGSLAPASDTPAGPEWSYDLPEPGRALGFRQLLVTRSAPRLALAYDVDLTGAYFTLDPKLDAR